MCVTQKPAEWRHSEHRDFCIDRYWGADLEKSTHHLSTAGNLLGRNWHTDTQLGSQHSGIFENSKPYQDAGFSIIW